MQGGKSLFEFHSSLNLALPETVQIQADNHLQPAPNHFLSGNAKPQWLGLTLSTGREFLPPVLSVYP